MVRVGESSGRIVQVKFGGINLDWVCLCADRAIGVGWLVLLVWLVVQKWRGTVSGYLSQGAEAGFHIWEVALLEVERGGCALRNSGGWIQRKASGAICSRIPARAAYHSVRRSARPSAIVSSYSWPAGNTTGTTRLMPDAVFTTDISPTEIVAHPSREPYTHTIVRKPAPERRSTAGYPSPARKSARTWRARDRSSRSHTAWC